MSPFMKKQRVCRAFNGATYFKPSGVPLSALEVNALALDELEAMYLCDYEGLHQSAAAEKMGISSSTLQRLLYAGRKKAVDALYHSKAIELTKHDQILQERCHRRRRGKGKFLTEEEV
ncbi:MAG: DUF134 domain-containing protein [Pseudomonadota bacterium]